LANLLAMAKEKGLKKGLWNSLIMVVQVEKKWDFVTPPPKRNRVLMDTTNRLIPVQMAHLIQLTALLMIMITLLI
jgi:hypothetical protein